MRNVSSYHFSGAEICKSKGFIFPHSPNSLGQRSVSFYYMHGIVLLQKKKHGHARAKYI